MQLVLRELETEFVSWATAFIDDDSCQMSRHWRSELDFGGLGWSGRLTTSLSTWANIEGTGRLCHTLLYYFPLMNLRAMAVPRVGSRLGLGLYLYQ